MDELASAEQALAVARTILQTIGADGLHRATPCPQWDVAALADHLIDTIARLGAAAGMSTATPERGPIDQRIQHLTQSILAGWRRRGMAEDVFFGGRTLPAPLALGILCLELVVHGWDLAVALNRPYNVPDDLAAHIIALAQQTLTVESRAIAGFDPPVAVPADATPLDRLVAFTGRHPRQSSPRPDNGREEDFR